MGQNTAIAWTDHTFNVAWGCTKISPGCAHCYAETFSRERAGLDIWGPGKARRTFDPKHWSVPIAWNARAGREPGLLGRGRPHLVFSSSMCDLWEDHPTIDAEREKLWDIIRRTPNLHWQLLTKRPERIAERLPEDWETLCARIWLGTSIESGDYVGRANRLIGIRAAVHFISYEPALGPLDALDLTHIEWVIFGGESGPKFRAPAGWQSWARAMRDRCADADVAYFFKQSPAFYTELGTTLDGRTIRKFPTLDTMVPPSPPSLPSPQVLFPLDNPPSPVLSPRLVGRATPGPRLRGARGRSGP